MSEGLAVSRDDRVAKESESDQRAALVPGPSWRSLGRISIRPVGVVPRFRVLVMFLFLVHSPGRVIEAPCHSMCLIKTRIP